jgi:hypothetical protein
MSVLSARHASTTLVVLLFALIPTVVTTYVGRKVVETPRVSEALPVVLDGRSSSATERKAGNIRREFDSEDWVERTYVAMGADPLTVLVVRSYDMKRLYHHPELAVSNREYERDRVVTVEAGGRAEQVHVLPGTSTGLAAYALIYRGNTIGNPYAFQLRVAPELLLTGRRPLTLVFVEDPAGRDGDDVAGAPAVRALMAAVSALTGPAARD